IALLRTSYSLIFFFFPDPTTTELYTLSLHDALPICTSGCWARNAASPGYGVRYPSLVISEGSRRSTSASDGGYWRRSSVNRSSRSEEHTSELQSLAYLVCRLLLEKKKKKQNRHQGYL